MTENDMTQDPAMPAAGIALVMLCGVIGETLYASEHRSACDQLRKLADRSSSNPELAQLLARMAATMALAKPKKGP